MHKYFILSPDGFPIHPEDTYSTVDQVKEAYNDFVQRYQLQGYYSTSNRERLPLDNLDKYMKVKVLNVIDNNDEDAEVINTVNLNTFFFLNQ